MKKVLFIAVHPDDETLGCGGTILRHKAQGDEIHWLIVTNILETERYSASEVKNRQSEIETVATLYSFKSVSKLDFPTTKLDQILMSDLITSISRIINKVKPHEIYVSNRSDIHTDHQLTFKAVLSCTKNFRAPFIKRVLMYETLSETEFAPPVGENIFSPNVFIDVTPHLPEKLDIMKVYKSELMDPPYPRSLVAIEVLAKYRGSRIGAEYAEAFMLIYESIGNDEM